MSRDAVKTLFHPFTNGTLDVPGEGERVLYLGAEAPDASLDGFAAGVTAIQGNRGLYRKLSTSGFDVQPQSTGEEYDQALVLCGKHRGENEARIADAMSRTREGALIAVAGGKEDGIHSLRKSLEKLGLSVEAMPKYHGVVFWFRRPADVGALVAKLSKPVAVVENRFRAAAGSFSHDRVDPGSELLASRLPADFHGNAADFGAGWGYLSVMLAEKAPRTARIDLFEADHASLEFAKENLATNCPSLTTRFFWQDLVSEPPKEKYDLIIMNPPFHEGHAAEPSLGQAIIKTAAGALASGGELLLVANRGLPYEAILASSFRVSGEVCRNARYKVLFARR